MLPNTNCSFSVLFSVGHQGQDYFYLDKSIVSWIESLIDVPRYVSNRAVMWGISNFEK